MEPREEAADAVPAGTATDAAPRKKQPREVDGDKRSDDRANELHEANDEELEKSAIEMMEDNQLQQEEEEPGKEEEEDVSGEAKGAAPTNLGEERGDIVVDDEAIAMLLAQEETDPSALLTREESARRRARAAMQDEAELRLIRALLEAEQSKDMNKINTTQGLILSSDMYENDAEESFSLPSNPDDELWISASLPGEAGGAGGSLGSFSRGDAKDLAADEATQAEGAKPQSSSGWSLRRGLAAAKARALGTAAREPSLDAADKQGFSEEEMLTILGTEVEEDYIARFKVMLEQQLGADFFYEHDDIASNLDFWAKACLRARRFRIQRAIDLMSRYAQCKSEIETQIGADKTRVRELLTSGVLCFLGGARCREGRGILVLRMGLHDPRKFQAVDLLAAAHETTMHAIQQYPRLQAVGFTIINDMTGATTRNFDTKVPKLLSRTIESKLPIRYGRVIVVNPPPFFSAVFRVVAFFLSSKMRKRMVRVQYRPSEALDGGGGGGAAASHADGADAGENNNNDLDDDNNNSEAAAAAPANEVVLTAATNPLENYIMADHLPIFLGGAREVDYAGFAAQLVPESFDDAYGAAEFDEDDGAAGEGTRSSTTEAAETQAAETSPRDVLEPDDGQYVHTAFV